MTVKWKEFYSWAKDKKIIYLIECSSSGNSVKFFAKVGGGCVVYVNDDEIYNGECFVDAADAYDDALSR